MQPNCSRLRKKRDQNQAVCLKKNDLQIEMFWFYNDFDDKWFIDFCCVLVQALANFLWFYFMLAKYISIGDYEAFNC